MSGQINREETIARTGKMMLKGWAMMNTMCPICNSALLTMKRTGEIHCPGCEMPVVFEGSASPAYPTSSGSTSIVNDMSPLKSPPTFSHHAPHGVAPVPTSSAAPKSEEDMESAAQPFRSFEEMKKEYDANSRKRQDVSALLGDRMLSGWAMLGINCENSDCGTPLMKKPRSDEMECVSCGALYSDKDGEFHTIKTGKTQIRRDKRSNSVTEYSPERVAERDRELDRERERGEDVDYRRPGALNMDDAPILNFSAPSKGDPSSLIAQKLLVGWALLDEMCPSASCDANAPLMRDKTGVKHCVVCGTDDNGEEERADKDKDATPADSPQVSGSGLRGSSLDDYDDEGDEEAFNEYAKKRFAAAMAGVDTKGVPRPPRASSSSASASVKTTTTTTASATIASKQRSSTVGTGNDSAVLSILKEKMATTADALQKCDHVGDSASLAELILKLALASKAVADLDE